MSKTTDQVIEEQEKKPLDTVMEIDSLIFQSIINLGK